MTQRNMKITKSLMIIAVAVVILASTAVTASACEFLDNLCPWNWGRNNQYAATTYAPPFSPTSAPAVACCPTPSSYATARTACYMPQTSYRTVYRNMPVTNCQTVSGCDPCTGCPVTYYRPVTTYRRAAQLVPYTTYRMVWQNNSSCYTGCNTGCNSGGCGTGVATSNCNSCTSTTTTTTPTPTPTYDSTNSGTTGRVWSSQKQIGTDEVSPVPVADPTSRRSNYENKPFQAPKLIPAGQPASYRVRHASYERQSLPSNVTEETGKWQAVKR